MNISDLLSWATLNEIRKGSRSWCFKFGDYLRQLLYSLLLPKYVWFLYQ